jgi:hypothetical protein
MSTITTNNQIQILQVNLFVLKNKIETKLGQSMRLLFKQYDYQCHYNNGLRRRYRH